MLNKHNSLDGLIFYLLIHIAYSSGQINIAFSLFRLRNERKASQAAAKLAMYSFACFVFFL